MQAYGLRLCRYSSHEQGAAMDHGFVEEMLECSFQFLTFEVLNLEF